MTEHDKLVEKMAKAISGSMFPSERSREKARAALSAITEAHAVVPREPTEVMLKAAIYVDKPNRPTVGDVLTVEYRAMIQAGEIK